MRIITLAFLSLSICLLGIFCYLKFVDMKKGQSMPEFIFPKPTGQYAVGTKLFELTDPTRNDPETNKPRELVVQVWYPSSLRMSYDVTGPSTPRSSRVPGEAGCIEGRGTSPAEGKPGVATAPYAYEVRETLKKENLTEEQKQMLECIRTYAIPNALVNSQHAPYPLVIFGHGYGCPRGFYSFFCEEIASQGYIVVMVMHTGVSQLIRFADGHEVGLDPELEKDLMRTGAICFADIECMLNQAIAGLPTEASTVAKVKADGAAKAGAFGNELTSICDFSNVGMIGHSLGGMLAAQVCRRNAYVKIGISLDGPLEGPDATTPFHKPFMFMRTSNFYELPEEAQQTLSVNKDKFIGSIERFCRENGGDSMQIVVQGAEHMTFSDAPILNNFFARLKTAQPLPIPEVLNVISGCIVTFLNKHLKGQEAAYPSQVQHDSSREDFDFYIPGAAQHTEIEINPAILDEYVGQYRLGDIVFMVTKDKNKLYVQITGQSPYQVFPESETKFFYKIVEAQISFVKDENDKVAKLILHQGMMDQEAEKIK
jgi:dienelactone hydrolase